MEKTVILVIMVGFVCFSTVHTKFDLTNIKCEGSTDNEMVFETCLLKAVNRTYKYLTIRVSFPKPRPINNIKLNIALLRKGNGYRPFLYNITLNACKYLKNRKSNQIIQFAHSLFEKYSTLNRTCPYGERDELVEKLPASYINNLITAVLPVPLGEYAFTVTYYFDDKKVAKLTVYGKLS